MKHINHYLIIFSPITMILNNCSEQFDHFEISSVDMLAVSATLNLCGTSTEMRKSLNTFQEYFKISCEGSGFIEVKYANGLTTKCPVSYVTVGAKPRKWRYQIHGGKCEALQ